jgi:hypothetical protein
MGLQCLVGTEFLFEVISNFGNIVGMNEQHCVGT